MTDAMRPRRRSGVTATGIATALVGIALLVWQVSRVGSREVVAGLEQVGWGFVVILILALLRLLIRALAWRLFFDQSIPVPRVFAAILAGDAAGNVTPLGLLVSEPTKALYLRNDIPPSTALAAAAAENFFYSMSVAIVIVSGMSALLIEFALPDALRLATWIALTGMLAIMASALWLIWRRPSLVSTSLGLVPLASARAAVKRVRALEVEAYTFVRQSRGRFGRIVCYNIAFHLLSVSEAYVALWLLTGASATVMRAFILDSVGRVINVVFKVVPLKIGVDEMSASIVAEAIGYTNATGLTFALVRRARLIVWTIPGLVLLARRGLSMKRVIEQAE